VFSTSALSSITTQSNVLSSFVFIFNTNRLTGFTLLLYIHIGRKHYFDLDISVHDSTFAFM